MDAIAWLQRWYAERCNGIWEHTYGIEIGTLDNPGWYVKIDLKDTVYENTFHDEIHMDNGDSDWMRCTINATEFQGGGDNRKLKNIIEVFKLWIEKGKTPAVSVDVQGSAE